MLSPSLHDDTLEDVMDGMQWRKASKLRHLQSRTKFSSRHSTALWIYMLATSLPSGGIMQKRFSL